MTKLTLEEIEREERLLQAEIKKLELAIENTKQDLLELKKPKGFFASNKTKEIKATEQSLRELEIRLIDLQAMTASEFYAEYKAKEKKENIKKVTSGIFSIAGDIVGNTGKVNPTVGGIAGKVIGKGLKIIGKKISQ